MTAFLQFCMCRNEANVTNCSKNPTQSFRVNKKLSYVLALIVFYVSTVLPLPDLRILPELLGKATEEELPSL